MVHKITTLLSGEVGKQKKAKCGVLSWETKAFRRFAG
jgi:hypothetical protein